MKRFNDIQASIGAGFCVVALIVLALTSGCAPKHHVPPGQAKKAPPALDVPQAWPEPYVYAVELTNVVDGDTVDTRVYLGMKVSVGARWRLDGIDAWEVYSGPRKERLKGAIARDALEQLLLSAEFIKVTTEFDRVGKFGRPIGAFDILIDGEWIDVEDWLVANGHAVYREY